MSSTVPKRDAISRAYHALYELYDAGETDAAEGGVATKTLADELECTPSTARRRMVSLEATGEVQRAQGIAPEGHIRDSWIPVEAED